VRNKMVREVRRAASKAARSVGRACWRRIRMAEWIRRNFPGREGRAIAQAIEEMRDLGGDSREDDGGGFQAASR
jgi:hypothetical protein